MKKRHETLFFVTFGIALMLVGIAVLLVNFVLRRTSHSFYELAESYVIPIVLIYIGYYIFRGKEIPLPQIAAK